MALVSGGVISHWDNLLEGFSASVMEFYAALEAALAARQIPGIRVSRVEHNEAGVASARREYLRVEREQLQFDICAAPFGSGFFVSWWLSEPGLNLPALAKLGVIVGLLAVDIWLMTVAGLVTGTFLFAAAVAVSLWLAASDPNMERFVLALPIFGWLYTRFVKPPTYYRIDTTLMFQEAVHNAVLEIIDSMTNAKGIRALGEAQRKPIMRDFFARLP